MSDTDTFLTLLRRSGPHGVHSHYARKAGISGNPSQRAKDLADRGLAVATKREHLNGRNGSRYWLAEHAPDDANRVEPNPSKDAEAGAAAIPPSGGADLGEPPRDQTGAAQLFELPPAEPQNAIDDEWEAA